MSNLTNHYTQKAAKADSRQKLFDSLDVMVTPRSELAQSAAFGRMKAEAGTNAELAKYVAKVAPVAARAPATASKLRM